MTDNLDKNFDSTKKDLELRFIEALDKVRMAVGSNGILRDLLPPDSLISIAGISMISEEDYVNAIVLTDIPFEEKRKFLEDTKSIFYAALKTDGRGFNIIFNKDYLLRNPLEQGYLIENISRVIASTTLKVFDEVDLKDLNETQDFLPTQDFSELKRAIRQVFGQQGLKKIKIRILGFTAEAFGGKLQSPIKLESTLEEVRIAIIQTLIEAAVYGGDAFPGKSFFEQIAGGLNILTEKFVQGNMFYKEEMMANEFLGKWVQYSYRIQNAIIDNETARIFEREIRMLLLDLCSLRFDVFLKTRLESDEDRYKIFSSFTQQWIKVFPNSR